MLRVRAKNASLSDALAGRVKYTYGGGNMPHEHRQTRKGANLRIEAQKKTERSPAEDAGRNKPPWHKQERCPKARKGLGTVGGGRGKGEIKVGGGEGTGDDRRAEFEGSWS